ncbi:MAG: serine/threonine-protein kinase, partial [Lysobacterales bacterium]
MTRYPTIAGYEVTALLGRGGMATVYAARQLGLDREVAIKVVDLDERDAGQYILRFENEAQSLAKLRHPNIVGLYDYGRTAEGLPYYVMPLLDGGDLASRPRPLSEDAVLRLLDVLLGALAHAHEAGIIHRDIKPENILFDRDEHPLLADFGAAFRRSHSRLTETGLAIGSVGYMSPEQARGLAVDASADLYSLAVVAFECLVGQPPFSGPDALAVALAQMEGPPPTLPAGLRHWQRFFDRALAPHSAQRFPTAAAMRAGLGEIGTRLTAVQPAIALATRRPRRHWLPLAGLLFALLVVAWWWGRDHFDPAAVEQLIASGALQSPADPNALDLLLAAPTPRPPEWADSRLHLLAAAAAPLQQALESADLTALRVELPRWRNLVLALDGKDLPPIVALDQRIAERLQQQLSTALSRFDRGHAEDALQLYPLLFAPTAELSTLQAQVRDLPLEGERFDDSPGVSLVLLQRPGPSAAGLAIMAEPVSQALFERFRQDNGRGAKACDVADTHQGCLSRADALALRDWLNDQDGLRYRLPSRDELLAHADRVQPSDALAWSDTCVTVTTVQQPNVAQRAWGGVKGLFGGNRAQPKVERSCAGWYAVALSEGTPTAQTAPAP